MIDNFDSNVARRKPNIAEKNRPRRPWDIPKIIPSDDDAIPENPVQSFDVPPVMEQSTAVLSDGSPQPLLPSLPLEEAAVEKRIVKTPPGKRTSSPERRKRSMPKQGVSSKGSSLSDVINIHSNFCKLDNDVSDSLMPKLSASAQSIYLRLYRQSYGWNRNWAAESLPKLTEYCNLSLQTVRKAIKELESIGCIRKEFSDYHKATVYRVFLPSDIGLGKNATENTASAFSGGLVSDSLNAATPDFQGQIPDASFATGQNSVTVSSRTADYQNLDAPRADLRGQNIVTQSVFFRGTSVSSILESGGALPKNIFTYMNDIHIAEAVNIVDEFYDSIGFSVVARSLYRKSLLDFFDMIKSGFSPDDIRYAVRWTFKNSRSRPESFSLIKHTLHLAMNDMIQDLKKQSVEKEYLEEKEEALQKNLEWRNREAPRAVSADDLRAWQEVVEDMRASLNEHSFTAFIEPLRLDGVEDDKVLLSAPPDSVSWISDHYADRICDCYRDRTGRNVSVEIR